MQILDAQFFITGFSRYFGELCGKFNYILFINIFDNRNKQASFSIYSHTNVEVLFINNFLLRHINA